MGTWIEIQNPLELSYNASVVPFVGTWIEIVRAGDTAIIKGTSFPSWERGLKLFFKLVVITFNSRRSLRGNVD